MIKRHQKILTTMVVSSLLVGCSANVIPPPLSAEPAILQTRMALLNTCPYSGVKAKRESLAAAALGALVPAVIDTGLAAVGTALTNAAKEDSQTFVAKTNGRFYQAVLSNATIIAPTYNVTERADNGCIVVVRGYFSDKNMAARFEDQFYNEGTVDEILTGVFSASTDPWFYYEGNLIYSNDGTSFRIQTSAMNYKSTMYEGRQGERGLGILFSFSKPGSALGGTTFAMGNVITAQNFPTGFALTEQPMSGAGNLPGLPEVSTAFGTGWLPLPALSEVNKTALTSVRNAAKSFSTGQKIIIPLLEKYLGAVLARKYAAISALEAKVAWFEQGQLDRIKNEMITRKTIIKALKKERFTKMRAINSPLTAAATAEWKALKTRSKLEIASKNRENTVGAFDGAVRVAQIDIEIAKVNLELGELKQLLAVPVSLNKANVDRKVSKERLIAFEPFTVSATLTEKKDANAVLQFFADVFTKANEGDNGLSAILKSKLDPAAIKTAKKQAKTEKETLLVTTSTKRSEAILAAMTVTIRQSELDSLSDDITDAARAEKRLNLRKAELDAEAKCSVLSRTYNLEPIECGPYL